MPTVGLLSDTHSYLDQDILDSLEPCDEIWHAGDVGHRDVLDQLREVALLRAVYGNIDGADIRLELPQILDFSVNNSRVCMIHIGAYPPRYNPTIRALLDDRQPDLFVCGHSHILKVIYDKNRQLLHLNPGACGKHGFHKVRTMLRFQLLDGHTKNMQILEFPRH